MEILTTLPSEKMDQSMYVHARDHAPKKPRAVWAKYAECSGHFQYTPRIY